MNHVDLFFRAGLLDLRPTARAPSRLGWTVAMGVLLAAGLAAAASVAPAPETVAFPPPLESYNAGHLLSAWEVLRHRVRVQPGNPWATALFFGAIVTPS